MSKDRKSELQYPLATLAPYGPDNQRATKLVVGIFQNPTQKEPTIRKWFSESEDVRRDPTIAQEVTAFLEEHRVKQSVLADRILGCPHEEGVDYPPGGICMKCTFWIGRNRFSHEPNTENLYSPRVGRNDPCPCGSQKKFKKCCGST
jgi:hypothetical protein